MKRSVLLLVLLAAAGCQREERDYRPNPVASETRETIALVPLSPGANEPVTATSGKGRDYENNAYHLSQGKKLFTWFNCTGCHANGGGGSGPPLIDDRWIYGCSIEQIVQTIREGRPNGMPSFRGRIPDDQIWQIAAFVRSMSGNVPASAAPNRDDHMHVGPAENRKSPSQPIVGGTTPSSAAMPK